MQMVVAVPGHVQSVFSALSQGLEDDILESSIGLWADTAATIQALANWTEIHDKTLRQSEKNALYVSIQFQSDA